MLDILHLFFFGSHHVFTTDKQRVLGMHARVIPIFRVRLLCELSSPKQRHWFIGTIDKRCRNLVPLGLLILKSIQVSLLLQAFLFFGELQLILFFLFSRCVLHDSAFNFAEFHQQMILRYSLHGILIGVSIVSEQFPTLNSFYVTSRCDRSIIIVVVVESLLRWGDGEEAGLWKGNRLLILILIRSLLRRRCVLLLGDIGILLLESIGASSSTIILGIFETAELNALAALSCQIRFHGGVVALRGCCCFLRFHFFKPFGFANDWVIQDFPIGIVSRTYVKHWCHAFRF